MSERSKGGESNGAFLGAKKERMAALLTVWLICFGMQLRP